MKKFKISVALLAMLFAITSAFTPKSSSLIDDGFYANKDRDPSTEQSAALDDQSEVNIDGEVATAGSFNNWVSLHCTTPNTRMCAVEIENDAIVDPRLGSYQ